MSKNVLEDSRLVMLTEELRKITDKSPIDLEYLEYYLKIDVAISLATLTDLVKEQTELMATIADVLNKTKSDENKSRVYCKNCEFYDVDTEFGFGWCGHGAGIELVNEDDYCNFGVEYVRK